MFVVVCLVLFVLVLCYECRGLLVVVVCRLLIAGCLFVVRCCSVCVVSCWLVLFVGVCCSCCLLLVVCCVFMFDVCCALFVVSCCVVIFAVK